VEQLSVVSLLDESRAYLQTLEKVEITACQIKKRSSLFWSKNKIKSFEALPFPGLHSIRPLI